MVLSFNYYKTLDLFIFSLWNSYILMFLIMKCIILSSYEEVVLHLSTKLSTFKPHVFKPKQRFGSIEATIKENGKVVQAQSMQPL